MTGVAEDRRDGSRDRLLVESAAITLVFILVVVAVDPRGDIPLNDDWNFALATWWLADHGEFRFARFTGMSLRAQMVWGAVWTLVFGKSFEVLRYSTLVVSLGSVLLFHRFCAFAGMERFPRCLATLALLASPIFMWSSFTYMTQIPFLFATLVALYGWLRAIASSSRVWFAIGSLALVVSYFVRQNGIATIVGAVVALTVSWRTLPPRFRSFAAASLGVVAVTFVVLMTATDLLSGRVEEFGIRFALLDRPPLQMAGALVTQALDNSALILVYAVLGMMALSIPCVPRMREKREWIITLLVAIPLVWGIAGVASIFGPIPFDRNGNVISGWGFGPHTLRDVWIFGLEPPRALSLPPRVAITIVGVVLTALVSFAVIRRISAVSRASISREDTGLLLGAGALAGGLAILATTNIVFDRYALDAGWFLAFMLPLATIWSPWRRRAGVAMLAITLLFSAAGVSDYLEWNRTRWRAWERLQARGVPLDRVDAGYEINQYLLGGFDGPAFLGKPQFSVVDDEWIVSFNENVEGYDHVETMHYRRWSGSGELNILRRSLESGDDG